MTSERGILLQLALTTVFFREDCGSTLDFGLEMPSRAENLTVFTFGDGKMRMLKKGRRERSGSDVLEEHLPIFKDFIWAVCVIL